MDWVRSLPQELIVVFLLVLARTSGVLTSAPVFASFQIPLRFRALLAVALSVIILPTQLGRQVPEMKDLVSAFFLVTGEWLTGLILGLGLALVMGGIQLGGELMARTGGLMLAELFDPVSGSENPIFSQLFVWLATALFFVTGAYRLAFEALLQTFVHLPLGGSFPSGSAYDWMVQLLSQSFEFAVRTAAPVVLVLLAATLILGFVGRTLPQLNILAVGLGLNSLLMLVGLMLSLSGIVWMFVEELELWPSLLLEHLSR